MIGWAGTIAIAMGGCANTQQRLAPLRAKAAVDLSCPEDQLEVKYRPFVAPVQEGNALARAAANKGCVPADTARVTGCGQTLDYTYSRPNKLWFSAREISLRVCVNY
jgi:hypothetical protein